MYGMEMLIGKEYFANNDNPAVKKRKRNPITEYHIIRTMVKDKIFDSLVKEYIVKDKGIKSGVSIIKGTRISTNDILRMIADGYKVEEIQEEFPTINDERQLLAALVYEIRKKNCISFMFGVRKKI